MAKQLNVSLGFSADTSKAKKEIQDLQSMLTKIQTQPAKLFDDVELKKASQAAQDLQHHLNAAINVDTGKLDLNKFSQSLTSSKQKLSDLYKDLSKIGPEGQAAFLQVAKSINSADSSALNLGKKLKDLGTSLANTARWQISSSLLHGFMGAVQTAYHYAEDLNSSLNDIRIVTGASVEEMDKFAKKANEAARSLSATTTEYTKASLIFYQQGLSDDEVAKRTEVTIKMANAAGQSAQIVSDQLTAVWNNFYDGSKSLEYYADVMTALGAATASSTDEIAGGLEKFAAIGQTIGLSYEYAASALATITANTRQSEDVVGTALKTIFARIQGLNLGETLDDGTTLNKYSEALQKVGISIFDSTGELKKMDAILDEMGSKWETLNKAQQTALAQTVAGTRQYTQLVALMDNWDKGDSDSMQANLSTAYGAEGTLQNQADIYAESWEAARDRVTAAAEQIYASLLDDDFFITILNGFEKFLVGVNSVIDGMGGLKGILLLVGGIFTQHFAKEIPRVLSSIAQNFDVITGKAERNKQLMLEQNAGALEKVEVDGMSDSMSAEVQSITQVSRMTAELNKVRKSLSDTEIQYYENKIRQVEAYGAEATAIGKENEELKKLIETKKESIAKKAARSQGEEVSKLDEEIKKQEELIAAKKRAAENATSNWEKTSNDKWNAGSAAAKAAKAGNNNDYIVYKQRELELSDQLEQKYIAMKEATDDVTKAEVDLARMKEKRAKAGENAKGSKQAIKTELQNLEKVSIAYQSLASEQGKIDKQANAWKTSAKLIGNNTQETNKLKQSMVDYLDHLDNIGLAGDGVDDLKSKILDSETSAEQAAQAFDEWRKKTGSIDTTGMENLEQQIDEIEAKLRNMGVSQTDLDDLAEQFQTGAITADEYKQALERLQASSSKIPQHIMSASEGFGIFAGKLMQVTSAITALQNIGNIWKDEDASTGQKIMSTMSAMIPVISLVTTLTNKKSLADLSAAASAILQAVGLGGLIPVKAAETAATVAQTGANVGLMASMWPILLVTLLIVAAIGTLVAIFAGLKAIVEAVSNAYNADAIAAENAENAAKNLGEAYNECKQEYEDMVAAMENYKSARDALDNLTEGTKEYDAALKEANRAAMELVNQYGLIEGKDYEWQGNELVVKDEAMDRALAAKEAEADEAYAASQMANANAKALKAQSNLTDARREIRDDNGLGDGDLIWQGIGTGLLNGILPGVGSLIMANQMSKSAEMDAAIQRAVEEAKDNQNLFDTKEAMAEALNIDLNDTDLIDALWANQEQIKGLANEMNAAEAAWKMAAQNSANEILNNNETVKNSENAEDIMAAGGNMYSVAYEDAYNKYLTNAKDRGLFNTGTDASKKAFEDYAEKAGLNDLKNFEVTNYKGDGTVEYKYIDDQGQEQKVIATAEEIAATLAAAEAADKLGASAENLVKVFNALDASGKAYDQAMKDFLSTGNFENGTREEATALVNKVDSSGDGSINNAEASSYLGNQFGGTDGILSDEEAKQYGYESAQVMIEAFTKELNNIDEAWDSIELPSELKGLDNMSLKTAQAFENTIKDLNLGPAGEKAGKEYISGINKLVAGLSEEDQTKALEQLSTIDWSSWDALEQADVIMKEFGVDIDTTSEEWIEYAKNMRIASGAIPDFSKLKDTLTEISSILKDLDFGSIISDEDYQKLIAYNDEWERFFILQSDGTRMFIGDASQMRQQVQENIRQQREELRLRKEAQEGFKKANWGHKGADNTWIEADWENKSGSDTGSAKNLMNATGATEDMLNALGYTDQSIQDMITKATSGQADLIAQGEAQIREMYQRIAQFQNENMEATDADLNEMMASTATNLSELNAMLANNEISTEAWQKQADYLESVAAQNATTLAELSAVIADFGLQENDENYIQNLMRIAEGYESCADELADYQAALSALSLDETNEELKEHAEAAEDALRASIRLEEGAEEYGLEVKSLQAQSKRLAKQYGLTAEEAANLAIKNQRMNKGVSSLVDNWKDWKKQLKATDKTTQDYADAVVDCTEAIADLVGASKDLELPDEFFNNENMALIERALQGDVEAINQLGAAVAYATVDTLEFQASLAELATSTWIENGLEIDVTLDHEQFDLDKNTVLTGIEAIKNGSISAGEAMDGEWVAALNRMALATGMSVEEMNGLLGSLGVQAKVDTTYVKQPMELPTYTEKVTNLSYRKIPATRYNEKGEAIGTYYQSVPEYTTASVPGPPIQTEGYVAVAQISTEDNPLTLDVSSNTVGGSSTPAATYSPNRGSVTPSATQGNNSGGGDKTPAPAEKEKVQKRSEFGERYHTVTKQLENTSRELERASKAADKLWSRKRLKYLEEQNALLDEEIALLREQNRQAQDYLELDQSDLDNAALDLGYSIDYGENGEILNYDTIVNGYAQAMIAAQNHLNTLATKDEQDAYKEAFIDPLQEKIDAFEAAVELYYETLNIIQDNNDLIQEKMDQQMENNFEKWSGELELDIAINERDLEILEYYLSKVEDDVYKMAEAVAIMVGSLGDLEGGGGGQLSEYLGNLDIYNTKLEELNTKLAAGEITEAAYEEGLEEIRVGLLENLEALNELDKAMLEYYSDTLSLVMEEMDKYTEKMEHQTSILEHYANMMEILGKSQDYEALGTILEGQVKTIENELAVAEAEFEMYSAEAETKRQLYEDAVASGNVEAAEVYKREWEAAESAAMEAQSEMLEKTEAWAEAMRAVVENQLSSLAKTLEQSLTGGTSFDYINTQLERAASLQEEYLTTTNQIYETNKLMRTAQQEIDKTTNTVAKQRLKNFIKETDQLQNKSKLSKYELEIQQAKYDLLLAEIALEEAQQAKSTVRLQRDSEGNFGYVYTADQNQLEQAQQQLEDAQNSLYNIGLEGANSYAEKYSQTMQEMYDTLTSISEAYFNGEIASQEEYEQQILAAQEYYYQQLENYQELYGIAVEVDTRIIKDAWSSNFTSMIHSTEEWKNKVDDYARDAAQSLYNWYTQVENIAKKTGLDNIAQKVQTVTDKSEELKDTILGTNGEKGVITALQDELTAVSNLTGGYANLRSTLQGVITTYEELMAIVTAAQNNETSTDSSDTNNDDNNSDDNNNNNDDNNNDDGSGGSGSGDDGGDSGSGDTKSYQTGTISFSGDGSSRIWKDSSGKTYAYGSAEQKKMQQAFNKAYNSNGGYKGDYWIGWTNDGGKLNADVLHKKYGLSTGGYTGDWSGSYGKLAFLHQKELVLNAQDTENLLASMDILDKIISTIDLYSNSAQLGGLLHTPTYNGFGHNESLEQNVRIEASFPGVTDRNEIEEAFNNLVNRASQYANRK